MMPHVLRKGRRDSVALLKTPLDEEPEAFEPIEVARQVDKQVEPQESGTQVHLKSSPRGTGSREENQHKPSNPALWVIFEGFYLLQLPAEKS